MSEVPKKYVLDLDKIGELELPRGLRELNNAIADIGAQMAAYTRGLHEAFAPLQEVFARLAKNGAQARAVEQAGWLPHATTPFDKVPLDASPAEASEILMNHYRQHWELAEQNFMSGVEARSVDAEAKATFAEALAAHRHGLYRLVPRTLFPEIERVARARLYDGALDGITSLPSFSDTVGKLPAGDVLAFAYGMELFKKIRKHLYLKIGKNADVLAQCETDPVPNRHATVHGLISYSSAQNSLNMLVMADFLFHLIGVLGDRLEAQNERKGIA